MAEQVSAPPGTNADVVPELPEELQVEVTGACNLRCGMTDDAPPICRGRSLYCGLF